MKQRIFIFIIFSVLLSCKSLEDENTRQFNNYLLANFSLQINDTTIYCFIPANQCSNCSKYNGSNLSPDMNRRLIMISGFPASNFENFDHVYYDKSNAMLQLKMLDYGNRLVICSEGHVKHVISITDLYGQLDSLAKTGAVH
jgi:hypothetical protein